MVHPYDMSLRGASCNASETQIFRGIHSCRKGTGLVTTQDGKTYIATCFTAIGLFQWALILEWSSTVVFNGIKEAPGM